MDLDAHSGLHDHGGELGLGGDLVADQAAAAELEEVAARAQHLDVHADHVARPHRACGSGSCRAT